MTLRSETNLVVYGSLMKREELDQAGFSPREALPVSVTGYARLFDQMPSWRSRDGRNTAVLTARPDRESWMNAVLLLDVSASFESADHRERGYDRWRVPEESVVRHGGEPLRVSGDIHIYVGKPALCGHDLLPNQEYLRICLEGAGEWGDAFYTDFLRTTWLCDGRSLEEYVGRWP